MKWKKKRGLKVLIFDLLVDNGAKEKEGRKEEQWRETDVARGEK